MAIFITEADPAFPVRGGTNPVADLGSANCLNPISVIFMQFSTIIMPNNRLAPPWKILDQPLQSCILQNFLEKSSSRSVPWIRQ